MLKQNLTIASTLVAAILFGALAFAEDEAQKDDAKKSKHTIKEVMKEGLKGKESLNAKVVSGKATDKEKLALLDMYVSLVESEPPKGDQASWQKFAGTAALAAAKVAVGREGATDELKAATNCAKCHKAHKK